MTPTASVVLSAAILWLMLPMKVDRTRRSWCHKEYWIAVTLFGLAGLGLLLGIIYPGNPIIDILRITLPIAVGLGTLVMNVAGGAQIRFPGLFLIAVFVPMAAFAITEQLAMPLMSLALLAPAIVVPRDSYSVEPLYTGLRDSIRGVLIALIICTLAFPHATIGQCRGDKCSVWGMALGPLGTGNAFGVYLAFIAGIAIAISRTPWAAIIAILASAILVDATSSRSAILAWAITVVAALVLRWVRPRHSANVLRLLCLATAALTAYFAFHTWKSEDFTGRANLWVVAREKFAESPLFGFGPSFWVRQDRTSYVVSNYATHNLLLEVLVSAGVVGAFALLLSLIYLVRGADARIQATTLVIIVAWLASSVLEVTALPGRMYLLPGVLVLIFVHGQSVPKQTFRTLLIETTPPYRWPRVHAPL